MAGAKRKYDDEKKVERGDPLISGLAPQGSEEADHSAAADRVRPSRRGHAGCVERTTKGETTESDTAAARPSGPADERPSLCVSFFVVTRPSKAVSGPGAVRERTRAERPADWSGRSHQMAQFKLS